ncbi:MAG: ice-binding family protein, partial [Solirubrobacteraceae bacterium]
MPLDRVAQRGRRALGVVSLALLLAGSLATSAHAASVGLGSADAFSVLGASTVTNTGPSTLTGDLGVSPGTAITGFPPGTVNGSTHPNDGVAQRAQADLTTAYNDARGRSSTATVSADLAGRTLSPGVYTSATSLVLSGDLTLDAQGDPSAVFVFQAGSTLTTASGSHVLLIGGAQACNVFWVVDTATLGAATAFKGNILALTSISLTTGATLDGRALARNGAVSLDTNTVTRASGAAAPAPTPTPGPAATPTPTPTPGPAATPTPTPTPG